MRIGTFGLRDHNSLENEMLTSLVVLLSGPHNPFLDIADLDHTAYLGRWHPLANPRNSRIAQFPCTKREKKKSNTHTIVPKSHLSTLYVQPDWKEFPRHKIVEIGYPNWMSLICFQREV